VKARISSVSAGVIGALCSLLCGCGDFYTVHGRVRSCADRTPVSGASVHLTQRDEHRVVRTDADGAYRVSIGVDANNAPAELEVQKEGFQTLTESVSHNLGIPEDVCIQPAAAGR
jgi:hypothetical protein